MVQEKSAGTIMFRREKDGEFRYLLLHYKYKSDYWDFPRGNIREGETEEQAAVREIKEETGVADLIFVSGFKEKVSWFYQKAGETVYKEAVIFLAETKKKHIALSTEHIGYAWLSHERAGKMLRFKNAKNIFEKAHHALLGLKGQ